MTQALKKPLALLQAALMAAMILLSFTQATLALDPATSLENESDEFDDPSSLSDWTRLYQSEGVGQDRLDFVAIQDGKLVAELSEASSWYQQSRATFFYKPIAGDFVAITQIKVTNKAGTAAPAKPFSLAGLMAREQNSNDWMFYTLGQGADGGGHDTEVKNTINADSELRLTPVTTNNIEFALVRIGDYFAFAHRMPGGEWQVHQRYHRPDLSATLQVGLNMYHDYWTMEPYSTTDYHNTDNIPSDGDGVRVESDYFRFMSPDAPAGTNMAALSDAQVIAYITGEAQAADPEPIPFEPPAPENPEDVAPVPDDQDPDNNPVPPADGDDQTPPVVGQPVMELCPYTFLDIAGHWAQSYINILCARGVVQGKTPTMFDPDANVTRAEMTKIALEAFDVSLSNLFANPFTDVASGDWFAKYVQTAKDEGIVNGYGDGAFKPLNDVTRAEALAILTRAAKVDLGNSASALTGCNDVKVGNWYISVLSWAYNNDVIDGGNCRPNDPMTRAEVAKVTVLMMEMGN